MIGLAVIRDDRMQHACYCHGSSVVTLGMSSCFVPYSPMMSESRFTCAVQTEEAAHGAQTGTPALMLMMLMDGAVVTSMQGALMLGFLDVLGPLGSPGFLANCPCVN